MLATDEALRIAGGPGFVAGPIERAFRDARAGLINPPLDDVAYQAFAAALVERDRARLNVEPHRPVRRRRRIIARRPPNGGSPAVPPITELTRIEPVYLAKLERQGIFTTGLLLEVSETPGRRQSLADHVDASTNDVLTWRDEALMLNLAGYGPEEHQLFIQARIEGLRDILALSPAELTDRLQRGALQLGVDPPDAVAIQGWWDQARTLEEE